VSLTVREQVVQKIVDLFTTVCAGIPLNDPYTVSWSLVTRYGLLEAQSKKRAVLRIDDPEEHKVARTGYYDCTLRVLLEWMYYTDPTGDVSEQANMLVGEIQRRVREDPSLGGIAFDCKEVGNTKEVGGPTERVVQGVVFLNVQYRHAENDPRKIV